jgi:O-antigen/teichoic acid export membrane protein
MSITSSIFIGVVGKGLSAVVALAGTMIVSRVLTPSEIGAFSIAMAVTGFLTALRNFGTSNYLVQASRINGEVVGSAFAATAAISWSLGAIVFLLRGSVADFFGSPEISSIMLLLALNFVLSPFVMTAAALMMRQHRFPELVRNEVIAGILGVITGVGICLMGLGPVSLALGMSVQSVSLLAMLVASKPAQLSYRPRIKYSASVLRFGGWASAITMLNQLTGRAPELVLGRVDNVATAALYDRGAALSRMVEEQVYAEVVRVLLPAFAEEYRARPGDPTSYLSRLGFALTVLTPILLFLAVFADSAIRMLYGDQWGEAVSIGVLVALASAVLLPFGVCEQLLIGMGALRTVVQIKAVQALLLVVGLLFVPLWGLNAAGAAVLFSTVGYVFVSQMMVLSKLRCDVARLAEALKKPLAAVSMTFASTVLGYNVSGFSAEHQPLLHLLVGMACAGSGWLLAVRLLKLPAYDVFRNGISFLWLMGFRRALAILRRT